MTLRSCIAFRPTPSARRAALAICALLLARPVEARPAILVMPIEKAPLGSDLIVRVHVEGADPVHATLWAMGERDALYRAIPMEPSAGTRFEARLPRRHDGSAWRTYYVEVTGHDGRRWSNGSAESPFVIDLAGAALGGRVGGSGAGSLWIALLVVLPPLVLLGRVLVQPGRSNRDTRFWAETLAPVAHLEGDALVCAVRALCVERRMHPDRGEIELDPDRALGKLEALRRKNPELLTAAQRRHAAGEGRKKRAASTGVPASAERLEEDVFWFRLLDPLVHQDAERRERSLRDLASRAHTHPIAGRRLFSVPELRRQLERVADMDPGLLELRIDAASSGAQPPPAVTPVGAHHPSAGLSMVELLTALALMAVALGIGAIYLKPLEAPLRAGGEALIGLTEQTRARAISTTQVHRVRPISTREVVVEYASSCSSGSWTYDPAIRLTLPQQVTMDPANWSACFDRRGLSSQNVVVKLEHPDRGFRELELLRGGAMRWRDE